MATDQRKTELSLEDEPLLGEYTSQSLRNAMGQLMGYLSDTQMQHIDHFMPVESMDAKEVLMMDFGYAAEGTRPTPTHEKTKTMEELVSYR